MDYIIGKRMLAIGYSWRVDMLRLYLIANSFKLVREGKSSWPTFASKSHNGVSMLDFLQQYLNFNCPMTFMREFHAWYNVFLNIVFVYVCFGNVFSKGFLLIGCFCLRCIMCSLSILLSIILKCFLLGHL